MKPAAQLVYFCDYCGAMYMTEQGANQHEKRYCKKNTSRKPAQKPEKGQDLFAEIL